MIKLLFRAIVFFSVTLFAENVANDIDVNSSNILHSESYSYIPNLKIDERDALDELDCNETSYFNTFQNYHQFTEDLIIYNSNRIDRYFSGSRNRVTTNQSTFIDVSLRLTEEVLRPFEYNINFNTFFSLPNTENKYKLIVQNYNKDESIDQGNEVGLRQEEGNKPEFLLGFQYDALSTYLANVNFEIGAKFLGIIPDPYVRMIVRKSFVLDKYFEIWLSNDASYFVFDKLDNKTELRFTHIVYDDMKLELYNSYRVREKDRDNNITSHELSNSISISRLFSQQRGISFKAGVYSRREDDLGLYLNYYNTGIDFRQVIYKNWLYVEINPSMLWRRENHFVMTSRISVTMGMISGDREKYNDRAYRYSNTN